MKLGVTGYGVVGKATAGVMRRLGHVVVGHDVSPARLECSPDLLSAVQLVNEKLLALPPAGRRSDSADSGLDDYAELIPPAGVVHLRW